MNIKTAAGVQADDPIEERVPSESLYDAPMETRRVDAPNPMSYE